MKNMNDDVIQILKDSGAILEGHFIGVSGRHLPMYINKDAWLLHTGLVSKVCRMLAEMDRVSFVGHNRKGSPERLYRENSRGGTDIETKL
jgi:orotate phosphoribosyltransferase